MRHRLGMLDDLLRYGDSSGTRVLWHTCLEAQRHRLVGMLDDVVRYGVAHVLRHRAQTCENE